MRKGLLVLGLAVSTALPAFATTTTTDKIAVGIDFAMPYVLDVQDVPNSDGRGNFNMGLDGRWQMNDNINFGARLSFDLEEQTGTYRQMGLAPGMQYRWMPGETWNPYVRADLPIIFMGAADPLSDSSMDIGIGVGAGLAWNLGQAIGVQNMAIRYDFNFNNTFGMGDALRVMSIEFFRIGIDYKF